MEFWAIWCRVNQLKLTSKLNFNLLNSNLGKYETKDLLYSADLAPIEPEKTVVYGVKWVEGTFKEGKWDQTSKLIFPNSFNGEVKTDVSSR